MLSTRIVEILNRRNITFANESKIHTIGFNRIMHSCIMRTVRSATASGLINARRFGIKSANKMNEAVTMIKASQDAALSTQGASVYCCRNACKCTLIVASPMTPPKTATMFKPICTTVIKRPGCSCNLSTMAALVFPSLAMFCNLIRRAPANEISAEDTMALTIISKIKIKIALNKLIRFSIT